MADLFNFVNRQTEKLFFDSYIFSFPQKADDEADGGGKKSA